jgi:hypothetical protein
MFNEHLSDPLLKLHIASILKNSLQMLGIESELQHGTADGVRRCSVCGWSGPSICAAGVFECQMTAVLENIAACVNSALAT